MKKHYVRKNEDDSLTYIGAHGARPRNSIEISEELVGKSLKVVDGSVILDNEANDLRLAEELVKETDRKMNEMRAERNRRLSDTDHTQLADAPISDAKKNEYKVYRQALRDLPSVIGDVDNFDYPVKPE